MNSRTLTFVALLGLLGLLAACGGYDTVDEIVGSSGDAPAAASPSRAPASDALHICAGDSNRHQQLASRP